MNILLGVFAVISIIFCVSSLKRIVAETLEDKKSIDITAESMLFIISVFELIRLSIN